MEQRTKVASQDGTEIAIERAGEDGWPPVVLVGAAFADRSGLAPLASALAAEGYAVVNYDRRGRGESGDTAPYAVQREIEDLQAVIDHAAGGGPVSVFGYSSGATLVLRAAAQGVAMEHLLLYEPPFVVDGSRPPAAADLPHRLAALAADGRRGDAVELYQAAYIGMPAHVIEGLRAAPFRPALEAIAHTLAYDAEIVGDLGLPSGLAAIAAPTLVLHGEDSPPLMRNAARAVAGAVRNGSCRGLPGQDHGISPEATAAALDAFLPA